MDGTVQCFYCTRDAIGGVGVPESLHPDCLAYVCKDCYAMIRAGLEDFAYIDAHNMRAFRERTWKEGSE